MTLAHAAQCYRAGLNPQARLRRRDERPRIRLVVGRRGAVAPDRAGPADIADRPRDDMQMELAHDVAERADIDLVGFRVSLEEQRRTRRLFDQKRAVGRVEIAQFDQARRAAGPG